MKKKKLVALAAIIGGGVIALVIAQTEQEQQQMFSNKDQVDKLTNEALPILEYSTIQGSTLEESRRRAEQAGEQIQRDQNMPQYSQQSK